MQEAVIDATIRRPVANQRAPAVHSHATRDTFELDRTIGGLLPSLPDVVIGPKEKPPRIAFRAKIGAMR
jgi:hypothetical protein